eukprot:4049160-Alexandrium_andersonii.AAC.1
MHKSLHPEAAGAYALLAIPIEEVTHVGEEHDTPVAHDPRHNVTRGGMNRVDALPPPLHHGVNKQPVPPASSKTNILGNRRAAEG